MKRLSLYLFLILFTLQTPSQADDIRDFEIEGMSIGDSLLDYFSEEEIKSIEPTFYPASQKFYDLPIVSSKFKTYDQLSIGLKKGDNKYIIYDLAGDLYYGNNLSSCLNKKKEIINEIYSLINDQKRTDYVHKYSSVDDGKSFAKITGFIFEDGSSLRIYCTDWSLDTESKRDFVDMLSVNASSKEFLNWLDNKAYK